MRLHPASLHDPLAEAVGDRLRPGTDAPAGYSLRVESGRDGPVRRLHLGFEGNRLVARGRRPGPVIGAVLGHLGSLDALDEHTVLVDVTAYVRDGVAVLGPAGLRTASPAVDRAAAAAGLDRVAAPGALLGLDDGRLVVAEPLSAPALDAEPPSPRPGRYPVAGWLLPGNEPGSEPAAVPGGDALWALRGIVHGANRLPPDRAVFALTGWVAGLDVVRGPGRGGAAVRLLAELAGGSPL